MGIPKRKNQITIYPPNTNTDRRQELLDNVTKHDTYLPEPIFHEDLDLGMMDFVKSNFKFNTDDDEVSIIPKILTVQRWGEFTSTWEYSDEDGNIKLPFIALIRKPDPQIGSRPSVFHTIPDRKTFHYATVKTWNGTQMGADVYKIPQPVPIDVSFDVIIVCTELEILNKFNSIVLHKFASKQSYTTIKGHYIPIVIDSIEDNTPMELMDGRRFYLQTYKFIMLGYLLDDAEFEVKPAINRVFLMTEFMGDVTSTTRKIINKTVQIKVVNFVADGNKTLFSVGEVISVLFNVSVNGLSQQKDIDYYHIYGTSRITFASPPPSGSVVTIQYFADKNAMFVDSYGKILNITTEYFTYDGSSLVFTLIRDASSVIIVDINGLIEEENSGYIVSGSNSITLSAAPPIGSSVRVMYIY